MPRKQTFGPYLQTPESTIGEIMQGYEMGPSYIDAYPMDMQWDMEEIRGNIIRKKLKQIHPNDWEPEHWSKIG